MCERRREGMGVLRRREHKSYMVLFLGGVLGVDDTLRM